MSNINAFLRENVGGIAQGGGFNFEVQIPTDEVAQMR